MDTLDILKKSIDEEYEELLCLCNKLKNLNQNASWITLNENRFFVYYHFDLINVINVLFILY